jgi:hypothetical protein
MAAYYVRSGAAGAGTGANWANAYTTLSAAFSGKAAGDTFYVAKDHAETQSSTLTLTSLGTAASPFYVLCVDHTGAVPPTACTTGASISVTGAAASITRAGGSTYYRGIAFNPGNSGATNFINSCAAGSWNVLDKCSIVQGGTGGAINTASLGGTIDEWIDTTVQFTGVSATINVKGKFIWRGSLSAVNGATIPTTLISTFQGFNCDVLLEGVDLSGVGSGKTLLGPTGSEGAAMIKDCKLNASVTICTAQNAPGACKVDLFRSDSGGTNYRHEIYRYEGTQTVETTIIRSGGASDGTIGISWKVVTTANSKFAMPFVSLPIAIWNDTVGSPVTATIECRAASIPNDDELWLDAEFLGATGSPQASFVNDGKADILATGAAQTSSSETWGGSTASFKLSVTFTPQQKGWIFLRVKAAKASTTFYVDPKVTLS